MPIDKNRSLNKIKNPSKNKFVNSDELNKAPNYPKLVENMKILNVVSFKGNPVLKGKKEITIVRREVLFTRIFERSALGQSQWCDSERYTPIIRDYCKVSLVFCKAVKILRVRFSAFFFSKNREDCLQWNLSTDRFCWRCEVTKEAIMCFVPSVLAS